MEQDGGLGRRDEHPRLAQLVRLETVQHASSHEPEDVQSRRRPHRLFQLALARLHGPHPLSEQALRALGRLPEGRLRPIA